MKLTSFLTENRSAYGIVTDSGVIDLSRLSQTPDNLCSALTDPGAEQLALLGAGPVSYTHLTLPTNREV